ncbi:MAG: hypothetical protein PUI29_06680 [Aeromonadales bacterium]|nr:hypothetical protein [Aeromonadales bacterium]MDY2891086.1 hypothetical protein [Succinivibrio sp.]
MKRSAHTLHRMTALNRTRRRRIFMKEVRQRRQARRGVFFLYEEGRD